MKKWPVLLLMAVLITACGPIPLPDPTAEASPAPTATSAGGIEGAVTIGPACPVVKIDQPCPDQPFQATFSVLSSDGQQKITQFTTDENGKFRIDLPPGDYILHPELSGMMPRATDQPFNVMEGQYTPINVVFDSGIR